MATPNGTEANQNPTQEPSSQIPEMEPLLGGPRAPGALQRDDSPIFANLYIGTAFLAQLGAIVLFTVIWAFILRRPWIAFSGHPLAQSLLLVTVIQAILILQPTHTPGQKRTGARIHAALHLISFLSLITGIVVIEYNKHVNKLPHFHSAHAYIGAVTAGLLLLQYAVGFTMWATPSLYGSEERARSIWKYHRWSGYLSLVLLLVTVASATSVPFVGEDIGIKFWWVFGLSVIILLGVIPRVHLWKLLGQRRRY